MQRRSQLLEFHPMVTTITSADRHQGINSTEFQGKSFYVMTPAQKSTTPVVQKVSKDLQQYTILLNCEVLEHPTLVYRDCSFLCVV